MFESREQGKDLRDQMIPPLLLKHEMQMCRPPGVSPQLREQLPNGPIMRNGIADGQDTLEPEPAISAADHDAPLGRLAAVGMLHIVMARAVRLPYVDLDPLDGVAFRVFDCADA
jgi:hypothetical protein